MTVRTSSRADATLLTLLGAVTVTAVSTYTLLPPALPDIAIDFGVDASAAGLVVAAATLPGIVLAPVLGVLGDRYGRREVLAGCLVGFGLAGALAALAPAFWVLVAMRLVQGAGTAGLIGLVVSVIADHWHGAGRTAAMGRNVAVLSCSLVALPPIGGALAAVGGWRLTTALYGCALLLAAAVWCRLPGTTTTDASVLAQLRAAATTLRTRRVVRSSAGGAGAFLLLFGLLLTVLPAYLAEDFGLDPAARGAVLAVPALTSAAAALALGRLSTRFGERSLIGGGFALFAAGFAVVAASPSLPGIAAGLACYGLGEGVLVPTLQTAVAGAGPAATRAAVVAVFVAATRLGQTAGPLLAAPLIAGPGPRVAFALGTAVSVLLALVTCRKIEEESPP
jgi:MFS family permease